MKKIALAILFTGSLTFIQAQTNTNGINVPNTGATPASPLNTYTTPSNTTANPTNSTVPGANGSYTVDTGRPDMTSPPNNSSYTTSPNGTQGTTSFTPQTGSSKQKRKD